MSGKFCVAIEDEFSSTTAKRQAFIDGQIFIDEN